MPSISPPKIVAYSTDSAGMHASHSLPKKLAAISKAGFTHVELAFPDLESYASQLNPGYKSLGRNGSGDLEVLCEVARKVREMCEELGMGVLVVHPFSRFEGYTDPIKREESFERAKSWFKILKALNCQMLQVGSSDDPSSSSDLGVIIQDLQDLADEAAKENPPIKIAYEMWAWGSHINTWEHTWEICKQVDKPNFGLCLDTFQISARLYVDPTSPPQLLPSADQNLENSLRKLTETIPPEKIFYFQISDGSNRVSTDNLQKDANEQGISPLYAWSNKWRPLPFMDTSKEHHVGNPFASGYGGFLPILEIIRAVLGTGWDGPWSYEVFYEKEMSLDDEGIPEKWTNAGMACHERILKALGGEGPL